MNDYQRKFPLFSLCGLNCALCPIHHMEKGCPGCGGGTGHQSCAMIRCAQQHGHVEFCYDCDEYPCMKYQEITAYDSFISHLHMLSDFTRAQQIGLNTYMTELREKATILRTLLENYNAGRCKTFFCNSVNLLPLEDVRQAMMDILESTDAGMNSKEREILAVKVFQHAADIQHIPLQLRRKPKT